jgi:hypothetical protein
VPQEPLHDPPEFPEEDGKNAIVFDEEETAR